MKITGILNMLIIGLLFSSAFASPSGTRAQYDVMLECEDNEHYVDLEQLTFYTLKITNLGSSEDTYNLIVDTPPEHWTADLSVYIITVPASEHENIMLKVKTTCDCEYGESVVINVKATSKSDPEIYDKIQTTTTYTLVKVELDTDSNYVQLGRGESYTHAFTVNNEGDCNETFSISASQPPGLSAVLDKGNITLQSRFSGTVNTIITASSTASFGYRQLSIGAESLHNSVKFDFVYVTVIIGKIDLRVEKIELSNTNPKDGESVTVSMEISNIGNVNISGLMITVFNLTKEGQKMELGSEYKYLQIGNNLTFQRDMTYSSNFQGLVVEGRLQGIYEVFQKSYTAEELGLGEEPEDDDAYTFNVLVIVILVVIVIAVLILYWKKRD